MSIFLDKVLIEFRTQTYVKLNSIYHNQIDSTIQKIVSQILVHSSKYYNL